MLRKTTDHRILLFLLTIFAAPLYCMEAVETKALPSIPMSTLAEQIQEEPLSEDLVETMKELESSYNQASLSLLKDELIRLNKTLFFMFDPIRKSSSLNHYINVTQPSPFDDKIMVIYEHSDHDLGSRTSDWKLAIIDRKSSSETILNLPLKYGRPIDVVWCTRRSFCLITERAVLKYELREKRNPKCDGKEPPSGAKIKTTNPEGTVVLAEMESNVGPVLLCVTLNKSTTSAEELSIWTILCQNTKNLKSFALNGDGETIIGANGSNQVYIIERASDTEQKSLSEKTIEAPDEINLLACTTEGDHAALASKTSVYIAHIPSRKIIHALSYEDDITALSYSPCSQYLLVGFASGLSIMYDTENEDSFVNNPIGENSPIRSISFNPATNQLELLRGNNTMWSIMHKKELKLLTWQVIVLLIKASQYSYENLYKFEYFKKIAKGIQKKCINSPESTIFIMAQKFLFELSLKACSLCSHAKADCIMAICKHIYCERCLFKTIHQHSDCPKCGEKINIVGTPKGPFTVSRKLSFKKI